MTFQVFQEREGYLDQETVTLSCFLENAKCEDVAYLPDLCVHVSS